MTIEVVKHEQEVTLKLGGWLDTMAAPELGAAVDGITEASAIVLDFDGVEYIASSGLRQVVACYRKAAALGAAFKVINVGTETMSIFELTGLNKKMTIQAK